MSSGKSSTLDMLLDVWTSKVLPLFELAVQRRVWHKQSLRFVKSTNKLLNYSPLPTGGRARQLQPIWSSSVSSYQDCSSRSNCGATHNQHCGKTKRSGFTSKRSQIAEGGGRMGAPRGGSGMIQCDQKFNQRASDLLELWRLCREEYTASGRCRDA